MSIHNQFRLILLVAILLGCVSIYNGWQVISWWRVGTPAVGTLTLIEGYSAENPNQGRGASIQTLHYTFAAKDGTIRQGRDHIWFGNSGLRANATLTVLYDPAGPGRHITMTALGSARAWTILAAIIGVMLFLFGSFGCCVSTRSDRHAA